MSTTRVLIVDDQKIFRVLLHEILVTVPELELVGEAATGQEAIDLAEEFEPDVVLMDIELGSEPNGIKAGHIIKSRKPTTGIVLFSTHKSSEFVVNAPGWSYLLKNNVHDIDTLVRTINGAAWGIREVDPDVIETLRPTSDTPIWRLTPELARVLELMAQGYDNAVIAARLDINERAVEEWQQLIYNELEIESGEGVDPRIRAVATYLDQIGQAPEGESKVAKVHQSSVSESQAESVQISAARTLKSRIVLPMEEMDREHIMVLELVAQGYSDMAIAERLLMDERSVQEYLDITYHRLGIGADPSVHPRVVLTRTYLDSLPKTES